MNRGDLSERTLNLADETLKHRAETGHHPDKEPKAVIVEVVWLMSLGFLRSARGRRENCLKQ